MGGIKLPFCKQCGKEIAQDSRFCPCCGTDQTSYAPPLTQAGYETKNTGLTAVLALVAGIFGLWGVGHIYVGKITKGIALLVLGIIWEWIVGLIMIFGAIFGGIFWYGYGDLFGFLGGLIVGILVWAVVTLAIFIWQIYDAYNSAKYYNDYVQRYKKAPW